MNVVFVDIGGLAKKVDLKSPLQTRRYSPKANIHL